ncbi:stage II sporulation protein D [Virgibacillus sp. YIM 98842]|uniref:stage II sporulation protein D n=1 Tax=Virgibacillus sp. YIM 98842 TaxID=2663533 RepID=UPI0013DAF81E|nr:stage II sporulation protein D [Virgibacillus sp. YIM 98842]
MSKRKYLINPAKKKKTDVLKKIKEKQQAAAKTITPAEKTADIPRKKPARKFKPRHMLTKRRMNWKIPSFFFVSALMLIILVIPTLIVVPFGEDQQHEATTVETKAEPAVELASSPVSVSVMRHAYDEVENVDLEEYVVRVVASEMPAEFETEALKAQALAARTYIVNHKLYTDETDEYDVTDTVMHQVYKDDYELQKQWGSDYDWKINKIKEAVNDTQGEILTYNDAPITPAFFSTSNGYTENSEDYWEDELPYLRSVESRWDEDSPKFRDQKTFSMEQVEEALEIELPNNESFDIEVTRTDSERVDQLVLNGNELSGREVREKLELQSSDFSIKQRDNHLIFTTKGYGHGIGMSQYGANGMAEEGNSYQDIVKYYYKDVEVSTVTDSAPALVSR